MFIDYFKPCTIFYHSYDGEQTQFGLKKSGLFINNIVFSNIFPPSIWNSRLWYCRRSQTDLCPRKPWFIRPKQIPNPVSWLTPSGVQSVTGSSVLRPELAFPIRSRIQTLPSPKGWCQQWGPVRGKRPRVNLTTMERVKLSA